MTRFKISDVKATKDAMQAKLPIFGGMWQEVSEAALKEVLRVVPKDKRFAAMQLKKKGFENFTINFPNLNAGEDTPITKREIRKYKKKLKIRRRKMRYTIDFKMPQEKDAKEAEGKQISAMLGDLIAYESPEIWKIHDIRENKIEVEWADKRCDWNEFQNFLEWLENLSYIQKVTGIRRVEK